MSQIIAPKINMDKARAGLPYDLNPMTKDSFVNPDDIVVFGHAVARKSANEDAVKKPASGDTIVGVALLDRSALDKDEYPVNSDIGVMRNGRIYVPVEEAIAVGDDVYVRHTGKAQIQTITLDADLVTSNVISIDVNGTTIAETFASDHDTTMAAFAAAIAAHPDVATAVLEGGDNREVTVTADSPDKDVLLENESITLGASQAGIVVAETQASIPNSDRGKFRNDADSSTAVQVTTWKWEKGSSGSSELAVLSVV